MGRPDTVGARRPGCTPSDDSDEESGYVFSIGDPQAGTPTASNSALATIHIDGIRTEALVDSGASCNLLGNEQFDQLRAQGLDVELRPYDGRLFAYGGKKPHPILG